MACKKQIAMSDLEEGDLLQARRKNGLYYHWGVYKGHRNVIHYAPDPDASENSKIRKLKNTKRNTCVQETDIKTFAGPSEIYRNNQFDNTFRPFSKRKIVRRARKKLDDKGYNVVFNNCEHFATWCRYGRAISKQVYAVLEGGMALLYGAWLFLQRPAENRSRLNEFSGYISRKISDKLFHSQSLERVQL